MAKSKKEIKKLKTTASKKVEQEKILLNTISELTPEIEITALMPELEELVKKNPNRLIGCGG